MADEWNERLRCPNCGNTGMASLSQDGDSDMATVQKVPDGFKVVARRYSPDFHCTICNVAVVS
jgi:transcription elongation factor Elf1